MAEALIGGAVHINTSADSVTGAMACITLHDEKSNFDVIPPLNFGDLDITTDELILDEVDIHIQANLEDDLVKEALKTGVDLRQYSRQVETELQQIEQASIKDYIKESQNIASLHNQITACDSILEAVTKIREFILQKIYSFRKPMTNYQIPQNTLLKYRFFYQFLLANERTVAKEIRDEYVDTMSKIYLSYFKSYSGRLLKVQYEDVADKDDLMGVEDTAKKGFFSKPSLKSRNTIFTLGQRGAILSPAELEGPILIPHAAQRGDSRYPYETLFRSQHYALLDNGCREFLFLSDFFMVAGNSALDLFNSIMGKTLSIFLKNLSTYLSDCYDSIAVFLCIHIILRFRAIVAKRNIPALDKYLEAVLELLWPRFELILEMNIQSIRNTDPQKLGVLDTRPHYITRRYAEFSSAIVSINQTFPNERTNTLLGQLQIEVENFVLKMAAEFPSRRDQLIFLINNYDMMLSVLMERAADDSKEVESFQQLLLARTQEFIEEILSPPFGGMIAFVKESEALMEKGQLDKLKNDEARITQLVRGFSGTWKQSVEALSQDVMRSFTNFKNGTSIIQGALTQLIQYYHGFHKVLSQPTFRSLAVRSELINLHHLMVEVKKHKPNF
ncbi:vacuolar protein sorting-associated protein 52 homolog isoform X2 [Danio rerio]|uniref:Vacuolar protein sorting-associated protein 52 homolog n=1 Tax=Danio rerio TaxID=7955 RepID=A0AB32T7W2_DANRE|nr:vacuolar protein sorting-associated protein 52 homolog isoform X2 [Danio rerio]|eukprot:XP_021323980.1 vacuolar protein sorting-associated protein 52 homolog isoform X2 [Danio rerio]